MTNRCPIVGYTIDPHAARIQAGIVVLVTSICLAVLNPSRTVLATILFLDYLPRAISRPKWSASGWVAQTISAMLDFRPKRVDAGPKRFAARIAMLFALAIAILSWQGQTVNALIATGVLMFFATLEVTIDFCVACWLYRGWYAVFGKDHDPDQF